MNKPPVQLTEEPPPLTEAYHKARRSYVLFSALLMAWELIGFDVSEVPLENVKIAVKSPQAIPAVLIVLMGYFGLRLMQEWFQCPLRRREDIWAWSDFLSANAIALVAILIYCIQRLFEVQVAEFWTVNDITLLFSWFAAGVALAFLIHLPFIWMRSPAFIGWIPIILMYLLGMAGIGAINYTLIQRGIVPTTVLVIGGPIAFLVGFFMPTLRSLKIRRQVRGGRSIAEDRNK